MAVWMMLNVMALAVAPLGVLENRKFFLSMTKGLILRSAMLLLISKRPSFRYNNAYHSPTSNPNRKMIILRSCFSPNHLVNDTYIALDNSHNLIRYVDIHIVRYRNS